MDVVEVAQKYPELVEKALSKATGIIGELLVAEKLCQLGYDAEVIDNNSRQRDIIVTMPDGVNFAVETKAVRGKRPTWWVNKLPDATASSFWVLLALPSGVLFPQPSEVEMFVLTVEETAAIWAASDYNQRNPKGGDMRYHQLPQDAVNAWHKFPRVVAP